MLNTLSEEIQSSEMATKWITSEYLSFGDMWNETTRPSDFTQKCIVTLENNGDQAIAREKYQKATTYYTAALTLDPRKAEGLSFKWTEAKLQVDSWIEILRDADEVCITKYYHIEYLTLSLHKSSTSQGPQFIDIFVKLWRVPTTCPR